MCILLVRNLRISTCLHWLIGSQLELRPFLFFSKKSKIRHLDQLTCFLSQKTQMVGMMNRKGVGTCRNIMCPCLVNLILRKKREKSESESEREKERANISLEILSHVLVPWTSAPCAALGRLWQRQTEPMSAMRKQRTRNFQ